jgi:hypothetical protein
MVEMMKVKVLKPTLCQDEEGRACIAPTNRIVMLRAGKAQHFINTGIAEKSDEPLDELMPYKATQIEKAKSEAAEVGMAIAEAIAAMNSGNVNDAKAALEATATKKEELSEGQKAVKASGRQPKPTVFIDQDPKAV